MTVVPAQAGEWALGIALLGGARPLLPRKLTLLLGAAYQNHF